MARKKITETISSPLGTHELELALIRELAAYHDWDLRVAAEELDLMRRICRKTQWTEQFQPLVENLLKVVKETNQTVQDKDTTLITAAQTRLQQAVFALRDRLYR